MATVKYFATCNGAVTQLKDVYYTPTYETRREPANVIQEIMAGPFVRNCQLFAVGYCLVCNGMHAANRRIFRKPNPSLHKCDARCVNAKGHNCECSCGGENHGKGHSA